MDQELNLDNCAMYILCIKMMVDKNEMSQDGFNPDFLRKNIGAFVEKITLKSDFYKRVLDYDATLDTLVDALVYLSSIKVAKFVNSGSRSQKRNRPQSKKPSRIQ